VTIYVALNRGDEEMAETLFSIFVFVALITAMITMLRIAFIAIGCLIRSGVAASEKMCGKGSNHET
jgi:hypothetical protein